MIHNYFSMKTAPAVSILATQTNVIQERINKLEKDKVKALNSLAICGNITQARRMRSAIQELERMIEINKNLLEKLNANT